MSRRLGEEKSALNDGCPLDLSSHREALHVANELWRHAHDTIMRTKGLYVYSGEDYSNSIDS